jgi:bifunctional ADP-heptose synthase (sugar kinase/adenylyltransferase)
LKKSITVTGDYEAILKFEVFKEKKKKANLLPVVVEKYIMKVGIEVSIFDLFYARYLKMLEKAKRHCDYLIVGLQLDTSIDRSEENEPS